MKLKTVAGRTEPEPARSTAYYYGDLERIKRQGNPTHVVGNTEAGDTAKGNTRKHAENCLKHQTPEKTSRRPESPKENPITIIENSCTSKTTDANVKQKCPAKTKEIFRKPETQKENYCETVGNASEEDTFDKDISERKILDDKGFEITELENPGKNALEVSDLDDCSFGKSYLRNDYGRTALENTETYRQTSLRVNKKHGKNSGCKSSKNRAKCDFYISQKDSLSEHLKRIQEIQNRNDAAIDHIKWRSEDDTCVSLTEHLIWRTDPKLTDSWRADNVLSLTENIKWRTDSNDRKVTCPSLSENLKWSKDLECINLDPVVSLNERLKWKKLYEQDVKEFAEWKERVKYKDGKVKRIEKTNEKQNKLDVLEYVQSNEILPLKSVPLKEIPLVKKLSPEYIYSTPENHRYFCERKYNQEYVRSPSITSPDSSKRIFGETYSTAGTFPMPETKEKEPLLAELEVVGRVPLSQLDSRSTVRRSRSWYLCCPNVPDEEVSRESSWRYSSLRPVTVTAPLPGQNGLRLAAPSTSSEAPEHPEDVRAERDCLLRELSAERQRAAAQARAHDARLAELHGVIAELVRRRTAERPAIEEESDECESTTQPAGELENDGDHSRTDQNTSSMVSPDIGTANELPSDDPQTHAAKRDNSCARVEGACREAECTRDGSRTPPSDSGSGRHALTDGCCELAHHTNVTHSNDSCDREHGSVKLYPASPGRCESRQAKMASRVRLRKTADTKGLDQSQWWCAESAQQVSLAVCADAACTEAAVTHQQQQGADVWRARCARLQADCTVLQCALQRATDTAHRLSSACAVQESACVMVCSALKSADRALEAYDVLLALAETKDNPQQREAAEKVANQLLTRLEMEQNGAPCIGEPLLSPGPWMQHLHVDVDSPWTERKEGALRAHAARLKAETVTLREVKPPPKMFSYHDGSDEEQRSPGAVDMERAVTLQEALHDRTAHRTQHKHEGRHWLDAASETDL